MCVCVDVCVCACVGSHCSFIEDHQPSQIWLSFTRVNTQQACVSYTYQWHRALQCMCQSECAATSIVVFLCFCLTKL